jgi:hypothetical protein
MDFLFSFGFGVSIFMDNLSDSGSGLGYVNRVSLIGLESTDSVIAPSRKRPNESDPRKKMAPPRLKRRHPKGLRLTG